MIIDFIKSLFFPTRMVRFRYMSVIFAIGIFVLSSYLLMVPAKVKLENEFSNMVTEDNFLYLQSITKIPVADENIKDVFGEIYSKGIHVDSNTRQLTGENMGCLKAINDETITGVLELNSEGHWIYNGVDTKVENTSVSNVKPVIKVVDTSSSFLFNHYQTCQWSKTAWIVLMNKIKKHILWHTAFSLCKIIYDFQTIIQVIISCNSKLILSFSCKVNPY